MFEREYVRLIAVLHGYAAIVTVATAATAEMNTRTVAGASELENRASQVLSCHLCSFPGYQRLTRGRSLAAIRRDRSVAGEQVETFNRRAQRVGTNLGHDCVRSLTNIHRALVQCDPPVALQSDAYRRRIGQGSVPTPIPHSRDTHPAPQRSSRIRVEVRSLSPGCLPFWTQRLQASPNADARAKHLSGDCGSVIVKRVQNAEFQSIHSDAICQFAIQLFLRNCSLRNSEAPKPPRRYYVGVRRSR